MRGIIPSPMNVVIHFRVLRGTFGMTWNKMERSMEMERSMKMVLVMMVSRL